MLTTSLVHTQPISPSSPHELVPCALRISVAQRDTRIPTHFILLLDTSDSMNEENKLANVKQCIRLLMNVLGSEDFISLITFASDSRVVLRRVPADSTHRSMIETTVSQISTDGMTNLSAGLSSVYTLMQGETLKTGLILLTDGHANVGNYATDQLRLAMESLLERYPLLSLSSVAYGTNHNSELLQVFSRNSNGSYCIVNSLEDTAVAIGDTLGGLMSCAAQTVEVLWPRGSEVLGMYPCSTVENHVVMRFGDLYSGTDKILLANVPACDLSEEGAVQIRGMELPSFTPFTHRVAASTYLGDRDREIVLTRLQIQCATLFQRIREWTTLTDNQRTELDAEVARFAHALEDDFLSGHPVLSMLQEELRSIRNALAVVRSSRGPDREMASMLSQHETYVGLGRGATTSIQAPSAPPRRTRGIRRQQAVGLSNSPSRGGWNPVELNAAAADPEDVEERAATPPPPAATPQMTSPYQNTHQRRVTQVLRTMSTQEH